MEVCGCLVVVVVIVMKTQGGEKQNMLESLRPNHGKGTREE
jgi:hypothetical protein